MNEHIAAGRGHVRIQPEHNIIERLGAVIGVAHPFRAAHDRHRTVEFQLRFEVIAVGIDKLVDIAFVFVTHRRAELIHLRPIDFRQVYGNFLRDWRGRCRRDSGHSRAEIGQRAFIGDDIAAGSQYNRRNDGERYHGPNGLTHVLA